ncbi:AcrR family transcriptional regulator [Cryobacterium mesophilum]|uniref:TetR/AcrR family transcriptional regulator n=1 Tax=Terrimesophilobacter mesophilus TaxID=433647 RepID=A0A4R8VF62_9MICO|nr:helix-turn-helix domain-containing protein [Terrimesophilobacter mesophilus]MBB5633799.1 AcrR family transcriptional regulator [Terrimesophilobacter mesophilus]TFB80477.1 TetR/AcrR family transcriptional regulator [Terrimesophilobacter mesophilus]
MPDWIPRRSSAKGRLALAALEVFGTTPFDVVSVSTLARAADVTTGALYHHFGSKVGLYDAVRGDVERRVLDRIEGAFAARPDDEPAAAALAALKVAFDYLTDQGYTRLVGADHPDRRVDPIVEYLSGVVDRDHVPLARLLCAAWREALLSVSDGVSSADARTALDALHVRVQ